MKYIIVIMTFFVPFFAANSLLVKRSGIGQDEKHIHQEGNYNKKKSLNKSSQVHKDAHYRIHTKGIWMKMLNAIPPQEQLFLDGFFQEHQNEKSFTRIYLQEVLYLFDLGNNTKVKEVTEYDNDRLFLFVFRFKENAYSIILRGYYKKLLQKNIKNISEFIEIDWAALKESIFSKKEDVRINQQSLLAYIRLFFSNEYVQAEQIKKQLLIKSCSQPWVMKKIKAKNEIIEAIIKQACVLKSDVLRACFFRYIAMYQALKKNSKINFILERKEKVDELLKFLF